MDHLEETKHDDSGHPVESRQRGAGSSTLQVVRPASPVFFSARAGSGATDMAGPPEARTIRRGNRAVAGSGDSGVVPAIKRTRSLVVEVRRKATEAAHLRARLRQLETELAELRAAVQDYELRPYRHSSIVGRAVEVIRELARPMTADEIIAMLHMEGHTVDRRTLIQSLGRAIRTGRVFLRRNGRGYYELTDVAPNRHNL
jgi:hypothetical protein